jgi:hypothetical protein
MIITGRNYPWVQPLTIHVCAHKEKANCLRCKASGELIVNQYMLSLENTIPLLNKPPKKVSKAPGGFFFLREGTVLGVAPPVLLHK